MITNTRLAVATICLVATLNQTFASNILAVFPHTYYSHFKGTSTLVRELGSRGHNVTFVTPYPGELGVGYYTNITEISIGDIIDPIKESKDNFFNNDNSWASYWSSLKYTKKIGYHYSKQILENENVTKLIASNSSFDLVIVEDVSADALAVLSHVFNCPLVVVLSEPVSMFYDNYFSDNIMWKQYNEFRNAHQWVMKELYRKWFVLPAQNRLVREVMPKAPDLRDILYQTSLVLMPSYSALGNLVPKYQNVKQIGGFNYFGSSRKLPQELEMFYNDPSGMIVVSNNLPVNVQDQLRMFFFGNVDLMLHMIHFTSDVADVIGNSKVKLFIGDGDVYDTGLAVINHVPVLSISMNIWQQRFLIDSLVENKMAAQVSAHSIDSPEFNRLVHHLLNTNDGSRNASEILQLTQTPPIEEAIFWIEYVLKFEGAPHLRPYELEWTVHNHLIIIIIVLTVLDVALFLLFYWVIKHFPRLFGKIYKAITASFKRKRTPNISYIKL